MTVRIHLYQDADGRFHYQPRMEGVPNSNRGLTLCGRKVDGMRAAAFFNVGDARGKVHYDRGCDTCRTELVD